MLISAVIPTLRCYLFGEGWRPAFAGRRKRLVQQRFERVGCPTAINGLHRGFQGPIQAREVTLGDLLAKQGFDRGGQGGPWDPRLPSPVLGKLQWPGFLLCLAMTRQEQPFSDCCALWSFIRKTDQVSGISTGITLLPWRRQMRKSSSRVKMTASLCSSERRTRQASASDIGRSR